MLQLAIRTDQPEAEIALLQNGAVLRRETWPAGRQLAETIHLKIKTLLEQEHQNLQALDGIAGYEGPGSFTGLRIGLSVANALAYALKLPMVGVTGDDWLQQAAAQFVANQTVTTVMPNYGADPHITAPKR